MTFAILVQDSGDQFVASLAGVPEVSVIGSSREAAVTGLKEQLKQRVAEGQLLSIEVDRDDVWGLAGRFADDPTLRDICTEAYAHRDAELAE
jgi:hypothetical protein